MPSNAFLPGLPERDDTVLNAVEDVVRAFCPRCYFPFVVDRCAHSIESAICPNCRSTIGGELFSAGYSNSNPIDRNVMNSHNRSVNSS